METQKNLRPIEDVVCALFAKDTVGKTEPTSESEEDDFPDVKDDSNFRSSPVDSAIVNIRDESNDPEVGQPSKRRRNSIIQSRNPQISTPGPTGAAIQTTTPLETWNLLFPMKILDEIVIHTNEELANRRSFFELIPSYYHDVTPDELKAFLGLLYFSGVNKSKDTSLDEMWSVKWGWTLYRATMSCKRFELLSTCLRFDDKSTRKKRRQTDKFATVRKIWESFVNNCKKYYIPHGACKIDEQLISFRGRCPFKTYMAGETEKYGIKIVISTDPRTFYIYDVSPCIEKYDDDILKTVKSSVTRNSLDFCIKSKRNEMFWEYTTSRKTGRWPMRIWMAMLDLGAIDAMILHNFNGDNERMNRPKFLKNLAIGLVDAHLRQRMVVPSLRRDLRCVIEKILDIDVPTDYRKTNLLEKKVRCNLCPRGKDRKTRHACYSCERAICDEHRASVCADCCSQE